MAKKNTAAEAAAEGQPTTQGSPGARVWVRILKSGVHAEGGRFRAGARVQLATSTAERMVADGVAVKLPNYY